MGSRVVVVTGAGSGIGRATAEAFGAEGATVVCADIDAETAEATAARVDAGWGVAYRFDVADEAAWEAFAAWVLDRYGAIDVLVNNAGIGMGGPFLEHSAADWRRIVDVNLLGVAHGCRVFGQQLARRERPARRAHIVNVASAAAFTPSRGLPAYVATKAAVLMLSEALRAEMAEHDVGVSAICPGFIATNIYTASTFVDLSDEQQSHRGQAAGRFFDRFAPGPELVARRIISAVRRNRPVVPVTAGAWLAYGTYHLAPPMMRALARLGSETTLARMQRVAESVVGWTDRFRSARKERHVSQQDHQAGAGPGGYRGQTAEIVGKA